MAMEEKFDIDIPDEDAEGITTVHKAIAYIDEQFRKSSKGWVWNAASSLPALEWSPHLVFS